VIELGGKRGAADRMQQVLYCRRRNGGGQLRLRRSCRNRIKGWSRDRAGKWGWAEHGRTCNGWEGGGRGDRKRIITDSFEKYEKKLGGEGGQALAFHVPPSEWMGYRATYGKGGGISAHYIKKL